MDVVRCWNYWSEHHRVYHTLYRRFSKTEFVLCWSFSSCYQPSYGQSSASTESWRRLFDAFGSVHTIMTIQFPRSTRTRRLKRSSWKKHHTTWRKAATSSDRKFGRMLRKQATYRLRTEIENHTTSSGRRCLTKLKAKRSQCPGQQALISIRVSAVRSRPMPGSRAHGPPAFLHRIKRSGHRSAPLGQADQIQRCKTEEWSPYEGPQVQCPT